MSSNTFGLVLDGPSASSPWILVPQPCRKKTLPDVLRDLGLAPDECHDIDREAAKSWAAHQIRVDLKQARASDLTNPTPPRLPWNTPFGSFTLSLDHENLAIVANRGERASSSQRRMSSLAYVKLDSSEGLDAAEHFGDGVR